MDSLSLDANTSDQNGELFQFVWPSKNYDIAFDLKVVFTIQMYLLPLSPSPLKMGILKAGILVSVFLTVVLKI